MRKEWLQLRFGNCTVAILFPCNMKEKYNNPNSPILTLDTMYIAQKAKGTADARKHASETMKDYFRDPENRRKRSISMKGVST